MFMYFKSTNARGFYNSKALLQFSYLLGSLKKTQNPGLDPFLKPFGYHISQFIDISRVASSQLTLVSNLTV